MENKICLRDCSTNSLQKATSGPCPAGCWVLWQFRLLAGCKKSQDRIVPLTTATNCCRRQPRMWEAAACWVQVATTATCCSHSAICSGILAYLVVPYSGWQCWQCWQQGTSIERYLTRISQWPGNVPWACWAGLGQVGWGNDSSLHHCAAVRPTPTPQRACPL